MVVFVVFLFTDHPQNVPRLFTIALEKHKEKS